MNKHILITLSFLLIFASCRVSKHPGVTTVPRPELTETSYNSWLFYWQDQFDGHRGNVLAPTDKYPDVARQAYQAASNQYSDRKEGIKAVRSLTGTLVTIGVTWLIIRQAY